MMRLRSKKESNTLRFVRCFGVVCIVFGYLASGAAGAEDPPAKKGDDPLQMIEREIGLVKDGRTVRYVQAIGARLAESAPVRRVPLRFFVVDMEAPNAFALEGGEVFVSRGLLSILNSEDELANVLAHEVGHVAGRHHGKQRVRRAPLLPLAIATGIGSVAVGIVSPRLGSAVAVLGAAPGALVLATYSRGQENEADELGQSIAARAGWDPKAMTAVMKTLGREQAIHGGDPNRQSFFATHPTSAERATHTIERAEGLARRDLPSIAPHPEGFLTELDGLLVGPSGAEGVFLDRRFLHADLDFSISFPEAWKTANAHSVVGAVSPDKKSAALLQIVAQGDDPAAGAAVFAEQSKIALDAPPEALRIGNSQALRASATTGGIRKRTSLSLFWIARGGHIFQLVGSAPARSFAEHEPLFVGVAESFGRLAPGDRKQVTEGRLRVVQARDGESLEALVARSDTLWNVDQAAVANGLESGARLSKGRAIKLAIREIYSAR